MNGVLSLGFKLRNYIMRPRYGFNLQVLRCAHVRDQLISLILTPFLILFHSLQYLMHFFYSFSQPHACRNCNFNRGKLSRDRLSYFRSNSYMGLCLFRDIMRSILYQKLIWFLVPDWFRAIKGSFHEFINGSIFSLPVLTYVHLM